MLKSTAKLVAFMVALFLTVGSLAGCNTGAPKTSAPASVAPTSAPAAQTAVITPAPTPAPPAPITITAAFGIGFPDGQDGPFDDVVAKEIEKITGVTIENLPLGESTDARDTKLNIMLASGDYPEIVKLPVGSILQKYIAEKALLPIDDLVEQYGPNIKQVYGDVLKKIKNAEDGKLYGVTCWHGYTDAGTDGGFFGINIKHDLFQKIAPEMADSNEFITPEKLYELLKKFKEQYPKIGDKDSIPLTFSVDQKFYDGGLGVIGILKAAYGIKEYSEDADHNLQIDLKDAKYIEVLKLLNKLNREKLLDPEWTTLKYSVYTQKLAQGYAFATTGAWFETMAANTEISKVDPNGQYYAYVVAAAGVTNPPLFANTDVGSAYTCITKLCKAPDRAMQFLDFLASPDGNFLMFWGPKGQLWDVADGKRVIKDEYIPEYQADPKAFWTKYKVRIWAIDNKQEAYLKTFTYSDGTTLQPVPAVDNPFNRYFSFACKSEINTSYDSWPYQDFVPQAGTDEGTIAQKFYDIKESELFKIIINAKDDAEVQTMLNALIAKADEMGIEKLEAYVTAKYKAKLALLK